MKLLFFITVWVVLVFVNREIYKLIQKKNSETFNPVGVLFCFLHMLGTLVLVLLLIDVYAKQDKWIERFSEYFKYKDDKNS